MTDDAASPEDGEGHEDEAEAAVAPGLGVTALAAATGAVAGFAAGGPFGAAIGAASAPYLAVVYQKTADKIRNDRSRRADNMLEAAAEAAGLTPEQLADRAEESEQTRFLTDKAIQATADTIWPEGVRAIGRALAAGLLAKDKPVLDVRQRVLGIMKDLDELHVRLLELLVKNQPDHQPGGVVAVQHRIPSYIQMYLGERPDNPLRWSVGLRKWTTRHICTVMPDLQPVLTSLLGELRERGLVQENDTAPDAINQLGGDLTKQVNKQAGQIQRSKRNKPVTLRESKIRLRDPTWSPTELGEKILGFYAEAWAEGSQSHG